MTSFEAVHKKLTELKVALEGTKRLIIVSHDNPDPDGISCAFALQMIVTGVFKIPSIVRYTGTIARAENREMIRLLKLKMKTLQKSEIRPKDKFALVDCQPNTGNVTLLSKCKPLIVIDHHPLRKATKADFLDVRVDYGATATILAEYLIASAVEINTQISTALCYAISTETQHLSRGATQNDTKMYSSLFSSANKKILSKIENPTLPRDYFKILSRALHRASVYKNAVVSNLGEIQAPDYVPIVADLLLKCERMSWSLCMGRYNKKIIVSLRTSRKNADAGRFLRRLIGKKGTAGGHGMLAGGQITCASTADASCDQVEKELRSSFLKKLGHKEVGEMTPLLFEENAT